MFANQGGGMEWKHHKNEEEVRLMILAFKKKDFLGRRSLCAMYASFSLFLSSSLWFFFPLISSSFRTAADDGLHFFLGGGGGGSYCCSCQALCQFYLTLDAWSFLIFFWIPLWWFFSLFSFFFGKAEGVVRCWWRATKCRGGTSLQVTQGPYFSLHFGASAGAQIK